MKAHVTKIIVLLVGLSFIIPSVVLAERHGGKGDRWKKKYQELNLTDDQWKQVTAIHDEYKKNKMADRDQIQSLTDELNKMVQEGKSDDEIRKKHAELHALKNKMGEQHVDKVLKVRKILTEEQLKKYNGFGRQHHRGGMRPMKMMEMDQDKE